MSSARRPLWSACTSCWKPPRMDLADDDLREAQHPGLLDQLRASGRVLCQIDLLELELADLQQLLGALAERARLGRVDGDLGHYFTKYSEGLVAGPLKVQGRGSALAALRRGRPHPAPLYPAARQAWARSPRACGARAAASAGRLEPFFRLNLVLHEGRSDLLTVTAAETVDGLPAPARARRRARHRGPRLRRGRRACSTPPSRTPASTTCSATSSRCSTREPGARRRTPTSSPSA